MILLALAAAALPAGSPAAPVIQAARRFAPPAGPVAYRVTQVRRSAIGEVRVSMDETLRFEPIEGGFRAVLESDRPVVRAPAALVAQLTLAMAAFTRVPVAYRLDRSGHPVEALDIQRTWDRVLAGIDVQIAEVKRRDPGTAAALATFRTAFASRSEADRGAALIDMADTLLGFVPDALAPGETLDYAAAATGPGTIRRLADEDGATRFHVEASGGQAPAREVIDVAADPDGLLRWLRRTVTPVGAKTPDLAELIERSGPSGTMIPAP